MAAATGVQGGDIGPQEGGQGTPLASSLAHLKGLKEALELAELALAQKSHLRQQLLYRDILVFPEVLHCLADLALACIPLRQ